MEKLQHYTDAILRLTSRIREEYPELYGFLDENPVTIPCCIEPKIDTEVLAGYLESLEKLLKERIETHVDGTAARPGEKEK